MFDFNRVLTISKAAACLAALMTSLSTVVLAAAEEGEEEKATAKAEYVRFSPDFIVNLKSSEPHFLMVTIQGMSRGPEGIVAAKNHMPALRHQLLMLLSEQSFESLHSAESKQELMAQALERVQELLVAETGEPGLEAVFFTDFVVE